MEQIALPLDRPGGAGPLLHGVSNAAALHALRQWQRWAGPVAVLTGPPRAGKSLIASWFRGLTGGDAIDDAERAGDEPLFHAWNRAHAAFRPLLLVSRFAPADWAVALPDLASRLGTAQHFHLGPPDDALAAGLLELHLERLDRRIAPDALDYALKRMDRSHAAIERMAADLDRLRGGDRRPVGIGAVRTLLDGSGR